MANERGKFIVIEGIDGSGKTTQVERLYCRMDYLDIPNHPTREASDGPLGKILRSEYLSGKRKADPRITNLLYTVDRLDHITNEEDGILKIINEGTHVISDRYYMSSMAYYAMEFFGTPQYEEQLRFIMEQNRMNRELLEPDITFFIRISPDVAMERLKKDRGDGGLSIYETKERLTKIAQCYEDAIRILRADGQNIFCIDGTLEWDDILSIICKKLEGIVPGMFTSWVLPEEWLIGE